MRFPTSGRSADRIDPVIANDRNATVWFGIEFQSVRYSGVGMEADFHAPIDDDGIKPSEPIETN